MVIVLLCLDWGLLFAVVLFLLICCFVYARLLASGVVFGGVAVCCLGYFALMFA